MPFPGDPQPEYFVIEVLQHHDMVGISLAELKRGFVVTLKDGHWDRELLRDMAKQYGTKATQTLVERARRAADETQ